MQGPRRKWALIVTVGFLTIAFLIFNKNNSGSRDNLGELGVSSESSRPLMNRHDKPITRFVENITLGSSLDDSHFVVHQQAKGPIYADVKVIDWGKTAMKKLSVSQIIDYLLWTNQSSCQIAQYFGGQMVTSADGRSVAMDGQKAVCLDSAIAPNPDRCLVYSFGISNEWSFDDAMELYGCQIFSFDPSMNVSHHNRTESIHFYQMALDDVDKDEWNNDPNVTSRTLSSIYNMLKPLHGGVVIDYLKMDIEATEWRVLPQMIESGMMDRVRQLAVEIHLDLDKSLSIYRHQAGIIQSLENYGMIRFDSKKNMFTMVDFNQVEHLAAAVDYEIAWYNGKLLRV